VYAGGGLPEVVWTMIAKPASRFSDKEWKNATG
jgi:hypothetical protein